MVEAECARARRSRAPLTLVYLDIDRFKAINDRFGHAAGDQVLRQLAMAISETVRSGGDAGYRLGGDEFALVLPSSVAAHAEAVVRAHPLVLRDARRALGPSVPSSSAPASSSCDFEEPAAALVGRGDAAMYRQKASRRPDRHLTRPTPGGNSAGRSRRRGVQPASLAAESRHDPDETPEHRRRRLPAHGKRRDADARRQPATCSSRRRATAAKASTRR